MPQLERRTYREQVAAFKRKALLRALRAEGWHEQRAAKRLGIHRNTLIRLLRELGLRAWVMKAQAAKKEAADTPHTPAVAVELHAGSVKSYELP